MVYFEAFPEKMIFRAIFMISDMSLMLGEFSPPLAKLWAVGLWVGGRREERLPETT